MYWNWNWNMILELQHIFRENIFKDLLKVLCILVQHIHNSFNSVRFLEVSQMMIQLFSAQTASEVSLSVLSTEVLINWCHCFPTSLGSDMAFWNCNTFSRGYSYSPGLWHTMNLSKAIPGVDMPFNWGEAFLKRSLLWMWIAGMLLCKGCWENLQRQEWG